MTHALLQVLYGVAGGLLPGTLRIAWRITRGKKVETGSIDLTAYKTRP